MAYQLAPALENCGYTIKTICARNAKTGKTLAQKVRAIYSNNISKIEDDGGIVIIAVKDDAIEEVIKKLPVLKNPLVIHTSGATDIRVLKKFKSFGVLWQVQTIQARTKLDFKKVPLVIEANNSKSAKELKQLAKALSNKVYSLDSHQRRVLHLGAVFVNNFPNHLYFLAEQLLQKHKMPFEIYAPLILSTAQNGIVNPKQAQTGPAKRDDKQTMKNHITLLKDKKLESIYKLLSESITKTYK